MVLVSLHYASSTKSIFLSTWVNSLGCSLYAGKYGMFVANYFHALKDFFPNMNTVVTVS